MTKASINILYPFDPEIERTFKRSYREVKDNHLILQTTSFGIGSNLQETKSEFSEPKEIIEPVIMATNREGTLKELANPDMAY